MPITVEPTKPRMCHDKRFLNVWIKDLPLSLGYISGLPRYVFKSHFQTTFDDKSGYDHIRRVLSALLVSLAVSLLTIDMSANSLYTKIYNILLNGPIFNLQKPLPLLYARFWFSLVILLASPNLSLFLRPESGFWVSYLISSSRRFFFHKIKK